MSMPLAEAICLAETLEKDGCISQTALALRALLRGYNELIEEYHAYEQSVRAADSWEQG